MLLYPSCQLQQAFPAHPQTTPARESDRPRGTPSPSLHFLSSNPPVSSPVLQHILCRSLPWFLSPVGPIELPILTSSSLVVSSQPPTSAGPPCSSTDHTFEGSRQAVYMFSPFFCSGKEHMASEGIFPSAIKAVHSLIPEATSGCSPSSCTPQSHR